MTAVGVMWASKADNENGVKVRLHYRSRIGFGGSDNKKPGLLIIDMWLSEMVYRVDKGFPRANLNPMETIEHVSSSREYSRVRLNLYHLLSNRLPDLHFLDV
jgi:hypothetical protein